MPIPFLLAGAAVAAGAIGAVGHKDAKETNERAERMCNDAQELYENSKRSLEISKNEMEKSLLKLGNRKKKILDNSISQYVESFGRIKDINFEESTGLNEISNLRISSQDIVELVNMSNIYNSSIKSGAAGAATGAIITLAASGSLPIITSTLGTAGTALAIGEVGMAASLAGSALSLGATMTPIAAIAAPVVMFTGISASIKADENLKKANAMYSQATAACEKIKIYQALCEAISERSYMFDTLLIELDEIFSECTALLDGVTRRKMGIFKNKKVSYNDLIQEEKKLLMVTGSLAKAVKTIIDTPMLNEEGNLSFKSEQVYNDMKEELPKLIHNGTEVKTVEYGVKPKGYNNQKNTRKQLDRKKNKRLKTSVINLIIIGLILSIILSYYNKKVVVEDKIINTDVSNISNDSSAYKNNIEQSSQYLNSIDNGKTKLSLPQWALGVLYDDLNNEFIIDSDTFNSYEYDVISQNDKSYNIEVYTGEGIIDKYKISKTESGVILYHFNEINNTFAEGLNLSFEAHETTDEECNYTNYIIDSTDASSILNDGMNISYMHENVIDKDIRSVWSEGVDGPGIGEWIALKFDYGENSISTIKIINGLATNEEKYYNNNRLKQASLTFSDGSEIIINLEDGNLDEQIIEIDNRKTSYVILTILDVYQGSKYDDTCIAEIELQ